MAATYVATSDVDPALASAMVELHPIDSRVLTGEPPQDRRRFARLPHSQQRLRRHEANAGGLRTARGPRRPHGPTQHGQGFRGLSRFEPPARSIQHVAGGVLAVFATFGRCSRRRGGGRSTLAGRRLGRTCAGAGQPAANTAARVLRNTAIRLKDRAGRPPPGALGQSSRLAPNAPVMPSYSKTPPASSWPGP